MAKYSELFDSILNSSLLRCRTAVEGKRKRGNVIGYTLFVEKNRTRGRRRNFGGRNQDTELLALLHTAIDRVLGQAADAFKLLKMFVKGKGVFQFE
jgi:hypothetical protein